jgi:hypothetical protein
MSISIVYLMDLITEIPRRGKTVLEISRGGNSPLWKRGVRGDFHLPL